MEYNAWPYYGSVIVAMLRRSQLKTWLAPSFFPSLSHLFFRSWQIVGGPNGKAPAPVALVHHTNVKGIIHVTAVCYHDQATLS